MDAVISAAIATRCEEENFQTGASFLNCKPGVALLNPVSSGASRKRMIDDEDGNANGARAGATALVVALCVEISCDSVRCMRSNSVQQRSGVVVVVREDRAG